jgi:hypothetical protein
MIVENEMKIDNLKITVTEDHLKLLKSSVWMAPDIISRSDWDCAPCMDTKRPFGNSNLPEDIHRVLETVPAFTKGTDKFYSDEQDKYAWKTYYELALVLDVCTEFLSFELATYERSATYHDWVKK